MGVEIGSKKNMFTSSESQTVSTPTASARAGLGGYTLACMRSSNVFTLGRDVAAEVRGQNERVVAEGKGSTEGEGAEKLRDAAVRREVGRR
ncbi:MAG: hypothetical protein Q9157_003746 [Trypethelium eluteriae]